MAKSRRSLSLSLAKCAIFTIITFSVAPLLANSDIEGRIKTLELEIQNAVKSTHLPQDEQILRIKKEIDLLKMQQELDEIKSKRGFAPNTIQAPKPQSYETQSIQDLQPKEANQNYKESQVQTQTLSSYLSYNGSPAYRNGIFFGFEFGYINAKGELSLTSIISEERGGVNYGVMLGYAYFFSNYFGTRIYGSLNASHIKFNDYSTNLNTLLTTLNWGMNADLIVNVLALRNFDLGVYVGVFLGANTFLKTGYFEYIAKVSKANGFMVHQTCFDVALNAGFRMVLARSVWLEAAVKVPFLKSYAVNESAYNRDNLSYMGEYKIAFKPNYSASFRLLYQF